MRLSTPDISNSLDTLLGLPISSTPEGVELVSAMIEELNSRNYGAIISTSTPQMLSTQTTHAIGVNLEIFLSLPISKHTSSVKLIFSMIEELSNRNVSAYPLLGDKKLQEIIELAKLTE